MKGSLIIVLSLLSLQIALCEFKKDTCGGHYETPSGSFHSDTVEPEAVCTWVLELNPINATLNYTFLFFEEATLDDEDQVFIIENDGDSEPVELFTGSQDGFSYISSSLNVTVELHYSAKTDKDRHVQVVYNSQNCIFELNKPSGVLKPPVVEESVKAVNCSYIMKYTNKKSSIQYLSFSKEFDIGKSTLKALEGGSASSTKVIKKYDSTTEDLGDVMSTGHSMTLTAQLDFTKPVMFEGHFVAISDGCSSMELVDARQYFRSPNYPDYYPEEEVDCRWIFTLDSQLNEHYSNFEVDFSEFSVADSFDTIEIRDGNRKDGEILAYITNSTYSASRYIYSSGKSLWVRFSTDAGNSDKGFSGMVVSKLFGGYFKKSGSFSLPSQAATPSDTYVYMIETAKNTQVQLTIDESKTELSPNSQLWFYDGFDSKLSPLLDYFVSNRQFYNIISTSNKLMILAKQFEAPNTFSASFKGIPHGFHNISIGNVGIKTVDSSYIGNLSWIIRPHLNKGDSRIISLTVNDLKLSGDDQIRICKLDNCMSPILSMDSNNFEAAKIYVPILSGIKIDIQRSYKYSSLMTVFTASYEIIPACERTFNLSKEKSVIVESPDFPHEYPLYASCKWNFNIPPHKKVYLTFNHFDVLPYHVVDLATPDNATVMKWSGNELPNDVIINGTKQATITFQTPIQKYVKSASGFQFTAFLFDCGSSDDHSTGVLNTPEYPKDVKLPTLCIWKVTVPWIGTQGNDSHQYISFSTNLNPSETYSIYDGGSIRDHQVANFTSKKGGQSLRNNIIVVYNKTSDKQQPGATLTYQASSCPKSRQCGNGICIHDSWVCDGIGQCPDFADEKNCNPSPSSSSVKHGVAAYVVVICVLVFFLLGVAIAVVVPMLYRKYKSGNMYSSFSNIPVVTDT